MSEMTLHDIRKAGIEALTERLGPIGMVRFLQQYEHGEGNYTVERQLLLSKLSFDDILRDVKKLERS